MKINCAIIVNSLEEKEISLAKFSNLENKNFFTFNNTIKSINLFKSKKNFFSELELFYNNEPFFFIYPDENFVIFNEEEAYKSHFNLIIDEWIIKTRRGNAKQQEVSKVFIKSSFENINKFQDDWCNLFSENGNFLAKLEEYIFVNTIDPSNLYLIYKYVFEKLKKEKCTAEFNEYIRSAIESNPTFVELISLWGDYLYENNLFSSAKVCYENAIKMASHRQIYDFLPMMPSTHKKHPEKMLDNINKILEKYDSLLK